MSSNSRISSLHPIILALDPHHKTMRVKAIGGRFPAGFPQEQIGPSSVQTIKERIRSVRPYVTGKGGEMGGVWERVWLLRVGVSYLILEDIKILKIMYRIPLPYCFYFLSLQEKYPSTRLQMWTSYLGRL